MIGYLEGPIIHSETGKVIVFVSGVGFTVFLPENLHFLEKQIAKLYIHTHLREDQLALYGFASAQDLRLFELLITVSGVGPKIGLGIFSVADATSILNAIETSHLPFFTSISGVGKKTAQKIILDLKSKISKGDADLRSLQGSSELLDSLLSLGFQKPEINAVIGQIDPTADLSTQIKSALKLLKR